MIPFLRFFDDPRYEVCTLITGTQSGKTDSILDAMGWRLDSKPRPQMYVGPSRDFVVDVFEPRLMRMFDETPHLASLMARGKRNKKLRKVVNGVAVRLALGGSPASLAGDQAADIYIDEFDKMTGGIKGDADVFSLAKARADTYADRKIAVTSTPLRGLVETYRDDASGLEFWALAEPSDIESQIWAKWQSGTRHHWAWRCPHCESWFIPRMRDLKYPDGASPAMARRNTWLVCPASGCVIEEKHKAAMNAAGQFIAPGQAFNGDVIEGEPPDSSNLSLWVSGLASPFLSWGERIEELLSAEAMGDDESQQGAKNKAGELWSPIRGDVPDWQTIINRRGAYPPETLPDEALRLTLTTDVQADRLPFVIRAWGARATSWLIEYGELLGDTALTPVWGLLAEKLTATIDGMPIRLAFVDSGFRPGKKFTLPVNRVYQFCRRFKGLAYPTKGSSHTMVKPLVKARADVNRKGEVDKYGLELIRLDTDYWKRFVHERLTWPLDQPGAWHIHEDVTEDYCRQLVAESRIISDSGKPQWIERSRQNHYLDCEAMAAAAGFMLNVHHIRSTRRRVHDESEAAAPGAVVPDTPEAAVIAKQPRFERFAKMAARLNGRG